MDIIYSEQTMAPLDMCDKGGRGNTVHVIVAIYTLTVMHYPGIVATDHVYIHTLYMYIYTHMFLVS